MKANELLLWMSARREGSWQQFRAAVEELRSADSDLAENGIAVAQQDDFRPHRRLWLDLERMAHVEFFAAGCEEGWRVTPPVFAVHPVTAGFRAILSGARSPALLERVRRIAESLGCQCETLAFDNVPDVVRFFATDISAISEAATQASITFQPDAPLAILSHLPPCDPPSRKRPESELPEGAGWRIREFDTLALNWRTADRQHAKAARTALFEFQLYDRWAYFLRWSGRTFKLPRAVALYALLHRHRGLLRYAAQTCELSVPGSCRPPRLLERALVLCSGLPPSFNLSTSRLTYADVPQDIARFAAELLRQPLA